MHSDVHLLLQPVAVADPFADRRSRGGGASVTGGGNDISVNQSGVYDNKVDMTMQGDGGEVDITQSD